MSSYNSVPGQTPEPQQPWQNGGGFGQPPTPPRQTGPKWLPVTAGAVVGAIALIAIITGATAAYTNTADADPTPSTSTSAPAAPRSEAPKSQAPVTDGGYDAGHAAGYADGKAGLVEKLPSGSKEYQSGYHQGWVKGKAERPQPAPKPKPKPKPQPVKAVYVSERQWAKIVKSPDKYIGKRYVIYGEITQFDSATGDSNFRADTANRNTTDYGYFDGVNSWFDGRSSQLEDFVEGDVFRATVTVVGSYDYDTQIGGSTTVPELQLGSIKRIGHNS